MVCYNSIPGWTLNNLRNADNSTLYATCMETVEELLGTVHGESQVLGSRINVAKTNLIVVNIRSKESH